MLKENNGGPMPMLLVRVFVFKRRTECVNFGWIKRWWMIDGSKGRKHDNYWTEILKKEYSKWVKQMCIRSEKRRWCKLIDVKINQFL